MSKVNRGKKTAKKAAHKGGAPQSAAKAVNKLTAMLNHVKSMRPANAPRRSNPVKKRDTSSFPSQKMGGGVKKRFIIVDWDEYVAEVAGSVQFATTAYPLNPGQSSLFAWLSKMAILWEKYDFEVCEPYYKHEVSQYATNGQAGKVMLSCDYDATDAPPTTKQQVEDTWPHIDCMPYQDITLRLNRKEMRNSVAMKYVRPGAQPANTDLKIYDAGIVYVSTIGNANTTTIGELRIRYRVRLEVPVLATPLGVGTQDAHMSTLVANAVAGSPLGTTVANYALRAGSTITPVILSATTFALPNIGRFLVSLTWNQAVGSISSNPTVTGTTAATLVVDQWSTGPIVNAASSSAGISSAATSAVLTFVVDVSSVTNVITIGGLVGLVNAGSDLFVAQISSGLTVASPEERIAQNDELLARLTTKFASLESFLESSSSSSSSSSNEPTLAQRWAAFDARQRRLLGPRVASNGVDEEFKEEYPPLAEACPNCDCVKFSLSFGGYCSRNCLYEADLADGIVTQRVQGDDVVLTLGPKHIVSSGSHKK